MIDDCEQEVIATSMDRNISGQPGLNQDQSNPEDNSRDKNGHEVPDAKETEQGNRKTGDEGFTQGSLNPQDPSARKAYQGSLNPQDPSARKEYQGSLDPQAPSAGKEYQGSLDPQNSARHKTVQDSLDPQFPAGRKAVQGSLAPTGGRQKETAGSLPASRASDEKKKERGKAVPPSPQQTEIPVSIGADIAEKGPSSAEAAHTGSSDGEAAISGPSAGEGVTSDAGNAAGSDTEVSSASGQAGAGITAAVPGAAPEGTGEDAGAASEQVPRGTSEAVAAAAPEGDENGNPATPAGGTLTAAAGAGETSAEAGTAETSAVAGTAETSAAAGTAETSAAAGAEGSSAPAQTAAAHIPAAGQEDAEAQKKGKKKKKSLRKALAFWISFLLILLVLGGVYYGGYKYCETHFMPGSTINGFDCSGLTEEETEKRFADAADKYTLNIRFRGGSTEVLTAQDIGFSYKPDGSIGAMIYGQDRTLWPRYFFEDYTYTLELGGNYDPDLLASALSSLPELQEENMQKPEDAYIQFMDGNETVDGSFQIVPDNPGNTIDLVQLAAGVGDAAARYEQDIDAEQIAGAYKEADLKADDADLVASCKDLNDLVGASITYILPDRTELKLNSDVMKDWLVRDKKGELVKDDEVWDEKIWEFMELLAYNSNTIGTDREFNSTARGTITVTGGDYGYAVNQTVEHDLLVKDLAEGKVETRKPSYYISPYNDETENDGIGKTYIEVDLTAQHMWCYIDGKMVYETDCVTGDPTTKHETPTGVFGIMYMDKDATLRGAQQKNGKYEYETKVKYWMPFYKDCGFHDAWWRTAFGGEIYKGDGSHGCVNLSSEAAEKLFTSYCDDKMPVVIYK